MIADPPAQPLRPRRRVPGWAWIVGGCGVVVVLGVVLTVAGIFALARNFQAGGLVCLPKDFPAYAGASYQSVNSYVSTGGNTCNVTLDITASSSDATTYYQQHLDTGRWKTKAYDPGQGVLRFGRSDNPKAAGKITFVGHGTRTQVQIEYNY